MTLGRNRSELSNAAQEMMRTGGSSSSSCNYHGWDETINKKLGTSHLPVEHCGQDLHASMNKYLAKTGGHHRLYTIEGHPIEHGNINLPPPVGHKKSHHRHRSCPALGKNNSGGSSGSPGKHHHTSSSHNKGHRRYHSDQIPSRYQSSASEKNPWNDKAHLKYTAYARGPDGHFPHPTDPSQKGLPFHTIEVVRPGLPDSHLKPCSNTSPLHYNEFREHNDKYEHRQRELNYFVKAQHKHNKEVAALMNPSGKNGPTAYMHATTKPLGRLYFDGKPPEYTFSDFHVQQLLPPGYQRQHYDFWR